MKKLKCLWTIPELRTKLLFTAAMLLAFQLGSCLPVPFVAPGTLGALFSGSGFLTYLNLLSGSALSQSTVFALGVGPAINASIIMQLLCVAIPKWETLAKDDDGKKTIERYTRICTLLLSILMSVGYYLMAKSYGGVRYTSGAAGVFCGIVVTTVFTAGAMTVQWLGTLIDAKGIGSGLSLLIFAGIVSRWSSIASVVAQVSAKASAGQWWYLILGVLLAAFLLVSVWYAVRLNTAEKRVPVQYAGSGRRRGASSFIPLRLMMSGVMPVIFAGSVLGLPSMAALLVDSAKHPGLYQALTSFGRGSWLYILLYAGLIYAFNRFYLAIQFDPVEMAAKLRKNGGTVPGIRPGKPTSDYLALCVKRLSVAGAAALILVACLPMVLANVTGLSFQLGGTSLLIVAGVATELIAQVDSHITMRHHSGFLD